MEALAAQKPHYIGALEVQHGVTQQDWIESSQQLGVAKQ